MKTKLLLTAFCCFLLYSFSSAQQVLDPTQWENAKQNGTLDGKAKASPTDGQRANQPYVEYRLAPNIPAQPASNSCQCWQTRDSTWDIVPITNGNPPEYRNDDGSTGIINLPFNFCLYGTSWTNCYINNNGNVSFGAPYGTFTATGFPNNQFVMVAPFWSDVDTRNVVSGLPHYKITSTYMIVQWDSVGYYASHVDKINTFQLIITNGSDPIVPGGNVSFCYKDMQWTTGDASSGVNGFGGSDAIVGANEGNGVDYIQFGSFNQPGGTYNGPQNPNSGIDWLDYQNFNFDACTNSNNVPPTASGISICDTLHLCVGDTLPLNVLFFSPEANQTTTITVSYPGVTGYTIVSNTPGNTAQLVSYLAGIASNIGYNNITITATDNGTPVGVTSIPIVIQVSPAPVVTVTADTTDCNGPVQLNATGGLSYDWLPTSGLSCSTCPNPVASPTITTTYTVSITNGCTVDRTVTVYAPPVVTLNPDTVICVGNSVQLTATGGDTYQWSPTSGLSCSNCANPVATPASTITYTVSVSNAMFPSCIRTDSITITVNTNPPVINLVSDTSTCNGPVQLIANGGGTYSWAPSASLSCGNCSSPVAFPTSTTTYTVTVTNGCAAQASVTVHVPQQIVVTPPTSICSGDSVQLNASGGTSYQWAPSSSLNNANISNPMATPSVTTTYTVTVFDSSIPSCVRMDYVTITVNPTPVAVASNDTTICAGSSVALSSSGGSTYSWSPSTYLSNAGISNPVATPAVTTTYVVTVSNGTCTDNETVIVNVQFATAVAGADTTICAGESTTLSASGGTSYSWQPATGLNNANIANPVATPAATTTYTVTVTNANGCTDTDVQTVTVSPLPVAAFIFTPAVIFADSSYTFTDQSTGSIASWSWNFGDGNTSNQQDPTHLYALAGTYRVCLVSTSNAGCPDTTCWDVEVKPRDVEAPNVFTPNGDGTNDVLVFKNLEYYPGSELQIYDRWGALIYENTNYLNDWNGKNMKTAKDCVDGTYYYILNGTLLKEPITGFVELIRGN